MINIPKISVCIIAKNEEQMLNECLVSAKPIAFEIILVDTGSTDKTKEIAQLHGCRIFDFPWIDDFAAARNESLKYANGDYILVLDADERIINTDLIIHTLANSAQNIGGWLCKMVSNSTVDSTKQTNITTVLRLFRNKPEFRFEGIIHEQIVHSIIKSGYKLNITNIEIMHIGYDLSEEIMRKKQFRNLELLNKWLLNNPNDYFLKTHKAKTLLAIGEVKQACEFFDSFINKIDDNNPSKIDALNNAAIAAYRNNDIEKAIEFALMSYKLLPTQAFVNFILGELYTLINNHEKALEAYLKMQSAIQNPDITATIPGEFHISPEQLHWRIGRTFMALNDYDKAIYEFEKGLKFAPNDSFCLVGIANIAFKLKQFEEAKSVLEIALKANPTHTQINDFIKQVDNIIQYRNTNKNTNQTEKSSKKLLSVCMIVKNEEKMLDGCLESVKNIADEIIIVDTGSTDSTIEIAKRYNARIFNFEWNNDFATARNESIKYATSEWILYIDADERLTSFSQLQIRSLLSTADNNVGAYFCTIESDHFQMDGSTEKHRGAYPRLFRNLGYPQIHFIGRVHEQISPSIIAMKKILLPSDLIIEHLGYNLPKEEMDKKIRRNYNMLIEHVKEEPINGYAWFQLGQTLGQMGLHEEAEKATTFSLQCGDLADSVYASAAATLSQFSGRKKNFSEALYWANESLSKAPNQIYGLSLKAHSLLYMGRKAEAAEVFAQALKKLKDTPHIPKAGFDIDISESVLLKGLEEARK